MPSPTLIVAINASVRHDDEWFDDVDDLDRIETIIGDLQTESDPLIAAAIATSRIARSQAFSEGNKRTALLVGRWIRNSPINSHWIDPLQMTLYPTSFGFKVPAMGSLKANFRLIIPTISTGISRLN